MLYELKYIFRFSFRFPYPDYLVYGMLSDIFYSAKTIAYLTVKSGVIFLTFVDIRRQNLDPHLLAVPYVLGRLTRIAHNAG